MVLGNKVAIPRLIIFGLLVFCGTLSAQEDPPARVARLNYTNGSVSMEPAGVNDWAPADINRPFTTGDYLYTDQGAGAELHLDVAAIRMGSQTSFGFLNLDDRTVQLKLTEGDVYIRLHNFSSDQVFEVDTPNAAVTLLRDGIYRFRIDGNGGMSFVVARAGQAEINGGAQAFTLNTGDSATLTGTDQLSYDVEVAPAPDPFDLWCQQRDAHEERQASARYLPPSVIGYEDLDDYGSWQNNADYGNVWYPQNVDAGWAPYQAGHWAWIDPWGWTWIDSMPWGFAPFHYGRWAYIQNRWGWCPGPIAVGYRGPAIRPYYAPALVAWFGGAHFGVGVSIGGGGPRLGWLPLGFGEVYTPSYHCSPTYFRNVNVYNTRIVKTVNITNVYNNVYIDKRVYNQQYVNMRAPHAVMAMPQSAFASGRAVHQAGASMKAAELAQLRNGEVVAPPVAPTRQSFTPTAGQRPAPRPSAQVSQRQVIARNKPPATPVPFASRQQYLQQHAGQPTDYQVMHQSIAAHPEAANVRQVPAAQPVAGRPGQRVGQTEAYRGQPAKPAAQPSPTQPMPAVSRPGQPPAPVNRPNQAVSQQQSRPASVAPAPVSHGLPPNLNRGGNQPSENRRYNETTSRPAPAAAPINRPPATQSGNEGRTPVAPARNQQRTQTPVAQPHYPDHTQPPQPRQQAPQPGNQERSQPPAPQPVSPSPRQVPEARPAPRPEVRPNPEAHPAPAARPQEPHSAPAPPHESHPKDDHKNN